MTSDMGARDFRQVCFVDMPFGIKPDHQSGKTINFDRIYEAAIEPAILACNLKPIRGDREASGGIIHRAMFGRLLASPFVIADMTTHNANVFYELGIRHAAKAATTIPIFAKIAAPPFDVNGVRAIPYDLATGLLSEAEAETLKQALIERLEGAKQKNSNQIVLFSICWMITRVLIWGRTNRTYF